MPKPSSLPILAGAVAAALASGAGGAVAQQRQPVAAPVPTSGTQSSASIEQRQGPGLPGVNAGQSAFGSSHEVFRLLGLSGEISAPVTPAYNDDSAYRTFAGQPMRGGDAVLSQSMDGAP